MRPATANDRRGLNHTAPKGALSRPAGDESHIYGSESSRARGRRLLEAKRGFMARGTLSFTSRSAQPAGVRA